LDAEELNLGARSKSLTEMPTIVLVWHVNMHFDSDHMVSSPQE